MHHATIVAMEPEMDVVVPASTKFPIELEPPPGFVVDDPATWPHIDGRLEYVSGRLLWMPPCGRLQSRVSVSVVTILGVWLRTRHEFVGGGPVRGMDLRMGPASPRRATYDDLLAVPDTKIAEIIDGELVVSPRPAIPHARAASALYADLAPYDRPVGAAGEAAGWWLLFEPELHFDQDVLVPDLAGWTRARLPKLSDAPFFTRAPDWLCEVVAPSTARYDRVRKLRIYARAGVDTVWIVDPRAHTVEVFTRDGGAWTMAHASDGTEPIRVAPFEALALDPARWWIETA